MESKTEGRVIDNAVFARKTGYTEKGALSRFASWSLGSLARHDEALVVRYTDRQGNVVHMLLPQDCTSLYKKLVNSSSGYLNPTLLLVKTYLLPT